MYGTWVYVSTSHADPQIFIVQSRRARVLWAKFLATEPALRHMQEIAKCAFALMACVCTENLTLINGTHF